MNVVIEDDKIGSQWEEKEIYLPVFLPVSPRPGLARELEFFCRDHSVQAVHSLLLLCSAGPKAGGVMKSYIAPGSVAKHLVNKVVILVGAELPDALAIFFPVRVIGGV